MDNELVISVYGSHNAAIAMHYKGLYAVVEVERLINSKNIGLIHYLPVPNPQKVLDDAITYLLSLTDRTDIDHYITNFADVSGNVITISPSCAYKHYYRFDHHAAHAACAFYQSPYQEALTFTYDSGGDRGMFNVYHTSRAEGITLLDKFGQDLGYAYLLLADYMGDITREPLSMGCIVYAGKLMGLCSYGNIREEWLEAFHTYYEMFFYDKVGTEGRRTGVSWLMGQIGIEFNPAVTRFTGQVAWDLAATTQHVFEEQFYKSAQKYLDKYPDMPVTLSGGCALNVLLNARLLSERNGQVFTPPNPNDCGVAVGGLLSYIKPQEQVDVTYSGLPILDDAEKDTLIADNNFSVVDNVTISELAKFIEEGHIVGLINGNSEHGPRALGNRSILCNPIGNMKDVLNEKVKHREWFRPFAPVVRLEDVHTYFHFPEGAESRHMTFVAKVKEEYRDVIPAVTHEDNTGRLQTVTKEQNEFLYELLSEFDKVSSHGALLNTSFNVNGKPILTRLSDAFEILANSEMDAVYYKRQLIFKNGESGKLAR